MDNREFIDNTNAFIRELRMSPPSPESFDTIHNLMDTIKEYREYIQPNPASWNKYILEVFQILGFNTKNELKRLLSLSDMGGVKSKRAVIVLLRLDEEFKEIAPDLEWSTFLFFAMHFFQVEWGMLTDGQKIRIFNRNHNMREIYLEVDLETILTDNNFDDFFAFYNVISLIRGGPAKPTGKTAQKSRKQSRRYDLTYHLANKSNTVITLFDVLRAKIKSLSNQIDERFNKFYIGYYTDNSFCQIRPQKDQLKIWVNLDIQQISDPESLSRDVRNVGHYGTGKTEIILRSFNDLDAVFDIIRQAYDKSIDRTHAIHKTSGIQGRHALRKTFWTELLDKANKKTSLHSKITPSVENWLGTGAGKTGLGFVYVVRMNDANVELYIDNGDETWNKTTFRYFYKNKEEIEKIFGDHLDWQLLEDKRASRIRYMIYDSGLMDQHYWPKLQELLIDAMIRLQHAIQPFIAQMDHAAVTQRSLNKIPNSHIKQKDDGSKLPEILTAEKEFAAQSKNKSPKQGMYSNPKKGTILKVTLSDGRVIQESTTADTLIKVIETIGIERVYDLKLSLRGGPKHQLISLSPVKNQSPHPFGKYFIHTHCSTDDKVRIINKIAEGIGLNIKVEQLP